MKPKDILSKFPSLYDHPAMFDFSPPPGWLQLVHNMSEELSKHDVKITQVKSKFASLRCYTHKYASKAVQNIILKYENISNTTCEECGKPAKKITTNGWTRTVCKDHGQVKE